MLQKSLSQCIQQSQEEIADGEATSAFFWEQQEKDVAFL